jgi:hypothetical protein
MPYKIAKVKGGYKVKNKDTGRTYAKKPQTKEKAKSQLRAIFANNATR